MLVGQQGAARDEQARERVDHARLLAGHTPTGVDHDPPGRCELGRVASTAADHGGGAIGLPSTALRYAEKRRGEVAERLNAAVSKTVMGGNFHRGFESPPLRLLPA